ncbi:glutamine synthetase family protein [Leucobacter rhizosphaerae]|uniref:Glutamine synthetase family protein n=1 Tax=Leucobacter rhizosphaerae TaxID=2932245 RepID=A0ABY4FZB3_9MICO|nr:glutamine synthetase family protein [Leucobacter rhizosphaerae]UOQ61576.1 glutamine synthetase family protein [Leucobacter rhizosphaerae]
MTLPIAAILTADLVGHVRGRAFPADEIASYERSGSGWVPANLALDAFGRIITPNPFGAVGDTRLMPDPATTTAIVHAESEHPVTVMLGDLVNPDGTPWDCCPRTFLRDAIRDLEAETGLRVISAFEHEFMLRDEDRVPGRKPFSLESLLTYEPLGSRVLDALRTAGLEPEMWLPEFGDRQWEVTIAPAEALIAADRAILLKEIVRNVVREAGLDATFSPIVAENGGGNGVHIHLSLIDADGTPVTHDPARPGGLSEIAGSFAAGILTHAAAIQALTAGTDVSYERLAPGRWSVGGLYLGENNREALLRICPLFNTPGANHARQFNLEYRGADATSNPWIALGVLIRAGLEGIRRGLPAPTVISGDPGLLPEAEVEAASFGAMPSTLEQALANLERDTAVTGWLSPRLLETFLLVKRAESAEWSALSTDDRYRVYAEAY